MFSPSAVAELARRRTDVPGTSGKVDWHHAIVTKSDAMGLPRAERDKIDDPRNILLVDHAEHIAGRVPGRAEAARILCAIYGEQSVRDWFCGIKFKRRVKFPE